ncbi:importin-5 isoform X3 [Hydra vulgaris]|uniref:Importin-5 isoform X3 n=1 Tax=Hydra vulgaris TaxID=6087 RepID=A0ABM4B8I7_HYDVU
MADDVQQFYELVRSLMSMDNDVRNAAETQYSAIPESTRIQFLLQCMLAANVLELRTMAAVLFRRLISNTDNFIKEIDVGTQQLCKTQLIQAVQSEQNEQMRKKFCDCLAEFAKCYLDEIGNNQWPDILTFLYQCCAASETNLKEVALHILIAFPGIFGKQQETYIQVIKEMLSACIKPSNEDKVRLLSARAACTFITEQVEETEYKIFGDIYPGILQAIEISVKNEEDDSVLKCFVELVEIAPKLVRSDLQPTINLMLQILTNTNHENSIRHLALESIVTLSETAPAMIRKHGSELIPRIVPEMLSLMVDLEEDEDWSYSDDVEETDMDSNSVIGESSLDRFTCGVGGKAVLPHIISTLPPMLQHTDWRYRHAALMAISAIAEGCIKQMEPLLGNVVDSVIPFLQDPHPRVRHAACNALGQLATDFSVLFQKKFHAKVMPGLMSLMINDTAHPRVQAHAAAALVNFCEECAPKILEPYLDSLVNALEVVLASKIHELLQRGSKLVLEQILTTIATVADTAESRFTKYYERFMPSLKYIFQNAIDKDYRLLRGKSIECISLIGLAVGAEKFLPDASEVMQLLLKTQTDSEEIEADDPQISYLISAWARMCKIIGKDFVQYLPVVMPPVLKAAQIKPEVALLDLDDPQSLNVDEDDGWEFVNLGEQQKFGIKTAGLEDKSTACQMLVHYARELKEGFADYTEQVVKIMVPLLKFYFHDTVRVTAAESLPHLLECAKVKGDEYLSQMWLYICPELLSSIEREPEEAVVPELMDSFAKCVEVLGVGYITPEHLTHLGQIIHEKLEKHDERQNERHVKRKDEDYDEEVEEDLQDEHDTDEYILSKISDAMHALFKTHKETILPFFDQLLPDFNKLMVPERPASDRQWALCIYDDLLEYTGAASIKYQEYFLKTLLSSVQDSSPEVRQAAAYGCGIMAQFCGVDYSIACAEVLPLLAQVITHTNSRDKVNISSTENCISAVAKICKYNSSQVNLNDILPNWLTWLPITEDQEEAPHVYGYLCDLIESNHPAILGANNINLPKIVQIITEAIACEVFEQYPDVLDRLKVILSQIRINEAVWSACVEVLNDRQKNALSQL